eukprot:TRINITY_DN23533_c0_g1_i1.p1 TRINITY_DN23533_c0_g1~~TRINITY_DN23533_c0_g1_i1.p1  ORF type:complete len:205 (-),score=32.21 TRINITY_DN23533_c0_g1_i1:191-742(-)
MAITRSTTTAVVVAAGALGGVACLLYLQRLRAAKASKPSARLKITASRKIDDLYAFEKSLEQGSWANVHIGKEKSTGKLVAVKKFKNDHSQRAATEIENLLFLASPQPHSNIVSMLASYQDDKHIYVVEELCLGGSLFDRLTEEAADGRFTEKQSLHCMRQVLSAVEYCVSPESKHSSTQYVL